MRPLALLGGMTPDVTAVYYNLINKHVRMQLGKRHSAKLYIYSTDLEEQLQRAQNGSWEAFASEFIRATHPLVHSAEGPAVHGVALSAIIAHKVSNAIAGSLPPGVPFLDISDFIAAELGRLSINVVGLIGPGVTMTDRSPDFFIGKLESNHGVNVLVPQTEAEISEVNRGMFEEVVRGRAAVTSQTKQMFKDVAMGLVNRGAKALILGSTDLGFVLSQDDFPDIQVLDAAKVHAIGLAQWSLEDEMPIKEGKLNQSVSLN